MNEVLGNVPPITKLLAGASLLTTALCSLQFISKYDLFFNLDLILGKWEVWRVLTTFTYYGEFNIWVLIHLWILFSNCKSLEENSFRGRAPDFVYFLLLSCASMLLSAPVLSLVFLSDSLFICIVYVLSKKNPHTEFGLLGLPMRIPGSYLPILFLITGLSKEKLLGCFIGHVYFYFEDVFPKLPTSKDIRVFRTPRLM
jgi:Derlin-2/3